MSTNVPRRFRVAVDAMGGDFGPSETVQGALSAAATGGVEVLLVGDPQAIHTELARNALDGLPVTVVPAEGVIREGESPVQGLRQKPRASVVVCTALVKEGAADALVTMGSTGAAMAASSMVLGMMEGIERPGLGGPIIGFAPNTVLLELGSNLDCRPAQLLDFGALGVAFARAYLKIPEPRVALLSVGAEESKGNRQTRETSDLFRRSGLNFIGNIEGHDLALGNAEVVVCDGFVGNILMKTIEGIAEALARHMVSRLRGLVPETEVSAIGQELHELLNVVEHAGGGPLFGVKGIAVVGHGRFRSQAVANAVETARWSAEAGLLGQMEEQLERVRVRL